METKYNLNSELQHQWIFNKGKESRCKNSHDFSRGSMRQDIDDAMCRQLIFKKQSLEVSKGKDGEGSP
jgi:hypothetical protein